MAAKPLTNEAIAMTEKKMDMTLDDIIKMSKNNETKAKKPRFPNRSKNFVNNVSQDKSAKMQRFVDTRTTLRQGALAQRRSSFQGYQFPLATEAARKAAVAPIRRPFNGSRAVNVIKPRVVAASVQRRAANGGGFNVKQSQQQVKVVVPKPRPQTLDSLFANMKMQRTRVSSQQNNVARRNGGSRRIPPWQRARFGN